jgi:hypothetical protein
MFRPQKIDSMNPSLANAQLHLDTNESIQRSLHASPLRCFDVASRSCENESFRSDSSSSGPTASPAESATLLSSPWNAVDVNYPSPSDILALMPATIPFDTSALVAAASVMPPSAGVRRRSRGFSNKSDGDFNMAALDMYYSYREACRNLEREQEKDDERLSDVGDKTPDIFKCSSLQHGAHAFVGTATPVQLPVVAAPSANKPIFQVPPPTADSLANAPLSPNRMREWWTPPPTPLLVDIDVTPLPQLLVAASGGSKRKRGSARTSGFGPIVPLTASKKMLALSSMRDIVVKFNKALLACAVESTASFGRFDVACIARAAFDELGEAAAGQYVRFLYAHGSAKIDHYASLVEVGLVQALIAQQIMESCGCRKCVPQN